MFGSLTSLTGGGGLSSSSSASADGDNTFSNAFNYKTGGGSDAGNNQMLIMGAVAVALVLVVMRSK